MTYTEEQLLSYEVARGLANTHIAEFSAAIYEEEGKPISDEARLSELREASHAIAQELRKLSITDDEAVSDFIAKYRRVRSGPRTESN